MPEGTGEHRQFQLFTIFYIKKQSVHYRILRSYKDTLHGWNGGIFNMIRGLSETVIVPIAGIRLFRVADIVNGRL